MDFFTLTAEQVSLILQIVLCYFAYKALDQIAIMNQQNELTHKNYSISELREFEKFIRGCNTLTSEIIKRTGEKILPSVEMNDFTFLESADISFRKDFSFYHKLFTENADLYGKASECANQLEVISAAIIYGEVKEEIFLDVISSPLCIFVEQTAYVYIKNRNAARMGYPNTISLYKKYKPSVKKISEQITLIQGEMNQIFHQNTERNQ